VLVVEDDDEVAALVIEMLGQLGYLPTRVASAKAALGALADGRPIDLVLSDIMMPGGMNGLELAREFRQRRPRLPVLLTTGYAEAAKREADAAGIPVLPKPYVLHELATALEQARFAPRPNARRRGFDLLKGATTCVSEMLGSLAALLLIAGALIVSTRELFRSARSGQRPAVHDHVVFVSCGPGPLGVVDGERPVADHPGPGHAPMRADFEPISGDRLPGKAAADAEKADFPAEREFVARATAYRSRAAGRRRTGQSRSPTPNARSSGHR
jgi:CheY-like chemotaxis protein